MMYVRQLKDFVKEKNPYQLDGKDFSGVHYNACCGPKGFKFHTESGTSCTFVLI